MFRRRDGMVSLDFVHWSNNAGHIWRILFNNNLRKENSESLRFKRFITTDGYRVHGLHFQLNKHIWHGDFGMSNYRRYIEGNRRLDWSQLTSERLEGNGASLLTEFKGRINLEHAVRHYFKTGRGALADL